MHRLFSFYWLVWRERDVVGSEKWKALFGWVVRVIDRDITPSLKECSKTKGQSPMPGLGHVSTPIRSGASRDALASLGSIV